jgi:hypothetical protein
MLSRLRGAIAIALAKRHSSHRRDSSGTVSELLAPHHDRPRQLPQPSGTKGLPRLHHLPLDYGAPALHADCIREGREMTSSQDGSPQIRTWGPFRLIPIKHRPLNDEANNPSEWSTDPRQGVSTGPSVSSSVAYINGCLLVGGGPTTQSCWCLPADRGARRLGGSGNTTPFLKSGSRSSTGSSGELGCPFRCCSPIDAG